MKLAESDKRAARAALEALRETKRETWNAGATYIYAATPFDADDVAAAIARLDAQPTADEAAPGFTAWVTRDENGEAHWWWGTCPPVLDGSEWVERSGDRYGFIAEVTTAQADALLGDAHGEKAIRRVRIVPDGELGDE